MTVTMVDVRWQNGTLESGVRARDLVSLAHLDERDFFVGDLVEEADPFADLEGPDTQVRSPARV